MNIGIVGSRNFNDYDYLKNELNKLLISRNIKNYILISGGAKGADKLAERYAKEFNIEIKLFLPDWKKYGKMAGFVRNHKIIDNSDIILAFWNGYSKGTAHTIKNAKLKNTEIIILQSF